MRPAEIRRYVHVPDLTAAAVGAVIVCVLPSAVGTDGTVVVHVAAELADVLDHHVHAVGVTLAQMAAAGVVRPPAAEPHCAVRRVLPAPIVDALKLDRKMTRRYPSS